MQRSTSSPNLLLKETKLTPVVTSIVKLAQSSISTDRDYENQQLPIASSAWSPLIRWVENPMRLEALAVYTIAANAGVSQG